MRRTVRSIVTALALGFAIYFAARAIWWTEQPTAPLFMVAAIGLYLAATLTAVLAGAGHSIRLPAGPGFLALGTSLAVPTLVSLSLPPDAREAPFATWYIGAIGLLAVICIVRRRMVCGWVMLAALIVSSSLYLGIDRAFTLGLVGSITWVVVAQLLVLFWGRAVRDTERLADIQRAVSAWNATQEVRQRERRVRAQLALAVAGPVLSRTVAAHGHLSEQERLDARLAEGTLRDELRGAVLLNDAVRASIADARRRGAMVTVFDEGGMEGVPADRVGQIRAELAEVVAGSRSNRVIIRAGRDDRVAVTVVGRAAGGAHDDDAVDLWHEIPRVAD
ncbi:hypothetical protein PTQ19_10605 [Microbacterium esteraromaticum]|uniref:hypothetical protein n=2 Tax=Microbacterium esteraromaticum TaxID=57043 RepID=UPI0015C91DBA|nr:hypothetical protein [Microbacterium esteraromaticum]MBN8425758.1 hypothetical protein [Microbacterium esteraromaticum]MCA1307507.1 hypothetical protein [Microbacterium esteraromaticum]WDH77971.1 hypothetical protein PTQ19_10605 [Microbacterium esteraromaticum]